MVNRSPPGWAVNRFFALRTPGNARPGRLSAPLVPALLALLIALTNPAPSQEEKTSGGVPQDAQPSEKYRLLLEELERAYPDRDSVQQNARKVAARLEEFVRRHPQAPESGRARALAGEALLLGGQASEARRFWGDLAREGPGDEHQARGLYLLGDHYFRRETAHATNRNKYLKNAHGYFRALEANFPESRWTAMARRPLRYLNIRQDGVLPSFDLSFRKEAKEIRVTSDRLRGKLVLLDFWRTGSSGQREFEESLARDMTSMLGKYAELEGRVEILGINLDRERGLFEAAVEKWSIPWPQHHDGKGFESPLAELLAIPRVPHLAVVDPEGKLLYLGPDPQQFFVAVSAALKKLRGVESSESRSEPDDSSKEKGKRRFR